MKGAIQIQFIIIIIINYYYYYYYYYAEQESTLMKIRTLAVGQTEEKYSLCSATEILASVAFFGASDWLNS